MMVGGPSVRPISASRPWTFYALGGLFGAYLLFLYGPMVRHLRAVVPGREWRRHLPDGRHVHGMVPGDRQAGPDGEHSDLVRTFRSASPPWSVASPSSSPSPPVSAFAANSPAPASSSTSPSPVSSCLGFWLVSASVLAFRFLGLHTSLFTSALGAQLTWTLPFGLFAMFAVVNRFNRAWEEAAADLGASSWQRSALRHSAHPAAGHPRRRDGRVHAVL